MSAEKAQKDYMDVVYNKKDKPFTKYPDKLSRYLYTRYNLSKNSKLLDLGCGRGEFLRGFIRCGLKGYGVDRSDAGKAICPQAEIVQSDIENGFLPYEDNSFNVVFSKSVLEHFYYPEKLIQEIYRILKPGGLAITMVPDWESVYKSFYDDYTHRRPFTVNSLKNILLVNGFNEIKVEKFRQLPFLWKFSWLLPLSVTIASITPKGLKSYFKIVRFSKEVMLLSSAIKLKRYDDK